MSEPAHTSLEPTAKSLASVVPGKAKVGEPQLEPASEMARLMEQVHTRSAS